MTLTEGTNRLCDLEDLEKMARANQAEVLIANSHGIESAERLGIPLLRAGFPQYDMLGGYQRTWIGYRGTRQTLFDLANIMLMDSGYIHEKDAEFVNRIRARKNQPPVPPLYTMDEAEEAYADAAGREPGWSELSFYRGMALARLGRIAEAEEVFQGLSAFAGQMLAAAPAMDFFTKFGERQSAAARRARAFYLVGLAGLGMGDKSAALDALEQA